MSILNSRCFNHSPSMDQMLGSWGLAWPFAVRSTEFLSVMRPIFGHAEVGLMISRFGAHWDIVLSCSPNPRYIPLSTQKASNCNDIWRFWRERPPCLSSRWVISNIWLRYRWRILVARECWGWPSIVFTLDAWENEKEKLSWPQPTVLQMSQHQVWKNNDTF